jgi:hypothetical protein
MAICAKPPRIGSKQRGVRVTAPQPKSAKGLSGVGGRRAKIALLENGYNALQNFLVADCKLPPGLDGRSCALLIAQQPC